MFPPVRAGRQERRVNNLYKHLGLHREPDHRKSTLSRPCRLLMMYSKNDLDKLFNDYNVQENIDILHKIVTDAKERRARGETRKDAWREDLDPRVAVCAKTGPILEKETQRLKELLAEVCGTSLRFVPPKAYAYP